MKLVCFGDSNTYGFDPRDFWGGRYEAEARWPELLGTQTGWAVCNAGENGRMVPAQPWQREALCKKLQEEQADGLVLLLGTNDLLQGLEPEKIAARMDGFLQALPPVQVLLLAPPQMAVPGMEEKRTRLARAYEALAAGRGLPFCDSGQWALPLAFDGVHLTEEGHRQLAEKLRAVLEAAGASEKKKKSILQKRESCDKMQSVSYD